MNSDKKLYKDSSRKKICGVLAGISDYINADVTLVRILFALLTILFQPCIIIYIIFNTFCQYILSVYLYIVLVILIIDISGCITLLVKNS